MAFAKGKKLRIDRSGRILVPKQIRERLGLKPGTELEAVDEPGGLLLRPVRQRSALIKADGLWVHRGTPEPGAKWNRVTKRVREERTASIVKP